MILLSLILTLLWVGDAAAAAIAGDLNLRPVHETKMLSGRFESVAMDYFDEGKFYKFCAFFPDAGEHSMIVLDNVGRENCHNEVTVQAELLMHGRRHGDTYPTEAEQRAYVHPEGVGYVAEPMNYVHASLHQILSIDGHERTIEAPEVDGDRAHQLLSRLNELKEASAVKKEQKKQDRRKKASKNLRPDGRQLAATSGVSALLVLRVLLTSDTAGNTVDDYCDDTCVTDNAWGADSAYESFLQSSYDALDIDPAAGQLATVQLTTTPATYTGCDFDSLGDDAIAAAEAMGIDTDSFDLIAFYMTKTISCGFAGVAYTGGSKSWMRHEYVGVLTHELGHNYGVIHASTDSGNDGFQDCEYCDHSSVMGNPSQHITMHAFHRYQLGWMPQSSVEDVSLCAAGQTCTTQHTLEDLQTAPVDVPAGASLMVTLPRLDWPSDYYISFRAGVSGFDTRLLSTYKNKVSLHYYMADNTQLITTLSAGEEYTIERSVSGQTLESMTLRVLSISGTQAVIETEVGDGNYNCENVFVEMYYQYTNGWFGNHLFFESSRFFSTTLPTGTYGTDTICLPPGTYTPFACLGPLSQFASWTITYVENGVTKQKSGGADENCATDYGSFTVTENTMKPTYDPTFFPSSQPSIQLSSYPSAQPTDCPSAQPTETPFQTPSTQPSTQPSALPSVPPSSMPTSPSSETSLKSVTASVSLQQALVEDMLPDPSSKCGSPGSSSNFSFSFRHTPSPSYWDSMSAPYEPQLFWAQLAHSDENSNHSWVVRIGRGANIYSYIGPFGEVMPPQYHHEGPFVDEVWQMVAVSLSQNNPAAGTPYFIHQAGTYQREDVLREKPFFSPSLGSYCSDTDCTFIAWGQHAHVPTSFSSSAIYYTRYRDCGDGVMEVQYVMHNGNPTGGDTWDYLNVPWGGVKPSVLADALLAPKGRGSDAIQLDPIPGFGASDLFVKNIRDYGGYTIFAEDLPRTNAESFNLPCGDGNRNELDCSDPNALPLSLAMGNNNPCAESAGHTDAWGQYVVHCYMVATIDLGYNGCNTCGLRFTFPSTGFYFDVNGVIHWSVNGNRIFFFPSDLTAAEINGFVSSGDVFTVDYPDNGRPPAVNLGLSFIYGTDEHESENYDWYKNPTRIRIGTTSVARDYNVFTINPQPWVRPGYSYTYRQYVAVGRYTELDSTSSYWADEVEQFMYVPNERTDYNKTGRVVQLYSPGDENDEVFGAFVVTEGNGEECEGVLRCSGRTVPTDVSHVPLYSVHCGSSRYVGSDPYHFAPNRDVAGEPLRPYLCEGEEDSVRGNWTLLGYFVDGDCDFLSNFSYVEDFCFTAYPSSQPSIQPSSQPTIQPSSQDASHPSAQPWSQPSSFPSARPTSAPSVQPSFDPSAQPLSPPTALPTCRPTVDPTREPTGYPSTQPTSQPAAEPSKQPSSFPTSLPSAQPTMQSSSLPTMQPSTLPTARPSSHPSAQPSSQPTSHPSSEPSTMPSSNPTMNPSGQPSSMPTSQPSDDQCRAKITTNFGQDFVVTSEASCVFSIDPIDMDRDGDIDIVSASFNDDVIEWYENIGNNDFTSHTISTNADGPISVFAIDMDGDTDIDVVCASYNDDTIAWFENDGSNTQFTKHILANDADGARSVFAVDFDGDGDVDVLAASLLDNTIALFKNEGNGNFQKDLIANDAEEAIDVFAADLDGDGDDDVVSASSLDDTVAWYTKSGPGGFSKKLISNYANGAFSVHSIDVDGDGDLDILSASFLDEKVRWYENRGSEGFVAHVVEENATSVFSVYGVDLDGDGDADVLTASALGDTIKWYENDGTGNFTAHVITSYGVATDGSEHVIDVDTDGSVEIMSTTKNIDDWEQWYDQFSRCHGVSTERVTASRNGLFSVYAADMDGDGDVDVLCTSLLKSSIMLYENDGNQNFTEHTIATGVVGI